MTSLKLFLLGSPRIERDNAPVHVDTRKAIALFAYLACQPGFHSRDTLAVLLWPEGDNVSARAALRRTLSTLNQACGGVGLNIEREAVGLDTDSQLWIDLQQFQNRLQVCQTHQHAVNDVCERCLQPLAEATELYKGDFLQGFSLRDSAEFDLWQFQQAEHFQRLAASVLDRLARLHTRQGNYAGAIQCTQRWLTLDPLHEPAHRQLMRLFTWTGQRSQALRQYRECVRVLDQELGVAPLDETTEVYQAILENKLEMPIRNQTTAAEPTPHLVQTAPSPAMLPFVGRERELRHLVEGYTAFSDQGIGGLMIVEGEAGIGKTRLVETFARGIQARGSSLLMTSCYESESGIAYAPFIRAIRSTLSGQQRQWFERIAGHWLSELVRLLPELPGLYADIPPLAFLDGIGAQSHLFEAINQALQAVLACPNPGLLIIEDLQWADSASLDLLAYLTRRLRDQPVCVILTWRPEDVPRAHRLRLLVAEYQHDEGGATSLRLSRLDSSAIAQWVQSIHLPTSIPRQRFAERLFRESEGLPFFVTEYLALLHETQSLNDDSWVIPAGVQDLLHSRLARLTDTSVQVLSTAAVIERPYAVDILREASGRSEDEVVDGLDELLRLGLIRELIDSENVPLYDFYHDKLRTLVYQEISMARRRLLHRRVAQAILNQVRHTERLESVAGQIAQHFRAGGQEQEAAAYFYMAGVYSRRLYANREALLHFNTAMALGYAELAALHQAIGDLHTLLGEYSAALRSYESAAAHCSTGQLPVIEKRLGNIYHRLGEWDLAESYYRSAFNGLNAPDAEQSAILADWSLTCFQRGRVAESERLAKQSLEIAQSLDDAPALAQSHNILGILARKQQDIERARSHLEQSLNMAEVLGDPSMYIAVLNNLALVYSADEQYTKAQSLLELAINHCQRQGDRHREAALQNNLADVFHATHQTEHSMAHLKQAVTIFTQIGIEAGPMRSEIWKLTEW